MTWCISVCDFDIDVDLLFQENSTIGQKMYVLMHSSFSCVRQCPWHCHSVNIKKHQLTVLRGPGYQGQQHVHERPFWKCACKLHIFGIYALDVCGCLRSLFMFFFVDYLITLCLHDTSALTEKIVAVLPRMKCPHRLEPHQIQGLDFINIFPVVQVCIISWIMDL